jgi:RNA polymerase sigma-70 factor (ECF subfamily)
MANESDALSPEQLLAQVEWVRRLAAALVGRGEADEVVQQAYLQALSAPPRSVGNLRGWLTTVVRNVARYRVRVEERRATHEQRAPTPTPGVDPAESVARAELHRRVVDAVLALDEPYRGTLLMRFFDDLSAEAIAAARGLPVETVRTRVKRGLALLRARLAGDRDEAARAVLFAQLAHFGRLRVGSVAASSATAAGALAVGGAAMSVFTKCMLAAVVVAAAAATWIAWESCGVPSGVPKPLYARAEPETAAARNGRIDAGNSESAAARVPDVQTTSLEPAIARAAPAGIPKSGTIRGVVKNHLGRPVPGATVQPMRESNIGRWDATQFAEHAMHTPAEHVDGADPGELPASIADGEGRFECSGLSCFTDWIVGAFDAQFGASVTEAVHFDDDATTVERALVLAPRVHVRGTVRNELGEPMGGIPVVVNATTGGASVLTSSTAPDVGTWDAGWICATSFIAQTNAPGCWSVSSGSLDVDVSNQERVVDLVLRKFEGMATVSGPILDEAGGAIDLNARLDRLRGAASAAGSSLRFVGVVGFDDAAWSATADPRVVSFDAGSFKRPVVGERLGTSGYYGTVDRDHATYEVPLPLAFHGELALVVDGIVAALARIEDLSHAPPLLFSLKGLPRTAHATVAVGAIDAATSEPIELTDGDFWVDRATLEQPSYVPPAPTRSPKGGREFDGPLGRISIRVKHPGFAMSATEIELTREGERREVILPLDRAVAGLRGRMLDTDGKPTSDAEVRLYRRTLGSYVDCLAMPIETNASGAFEVLGLAADEYVVVVQSHEVNQTFGAISAGVARVRAANPPTEFEVRGRPATLVSVRFVRAPPTVDRPTMFRFVDEDGIPVLNMFGTMCNSFATGHAGAFLVPGHYHLFVWSKGCREATTEFDVPAAGPLELRLESER